MTHPVHAVPSAVFEPQTAGGRAHALVLAPVTPHWDGGAFFAPVTRALTAAGLRVTVVDTLSAWDEGIDSMDAFVARWHALLAPYGPVDLLCGNALGGAVGQALLPHVAPGTAALFVSGPARSDALLESRLTRIADLAAGGRSGQALALLNRRVLPHGHRPAAAADAPSTHDPAAGRRLAAGMRLLCGIDVTKSVLAHPGPLLQIVGGHSQLVAPRHTAAAPHHRVHVIAEAGMRPHFEHTAEVSALVADFLREKGLT
ncbi:alpha/beta hydrolase [Streptomyces sp. WAC 04229]|uniref:alpha/beta fold hydrolase n=1 Tax=Streptomyces sp. WAC 04229 TaxID=2203206 RepID=UPI000F73E261|nr:alpha/beta hydrolase [Streptomyces sp. WAC 04229]RSN54704.1 alpha/beta hydrolase [Streptomyces sp. WAC 04229]